MLESDGYMFCLRYHGVAYMYYLAFVFIFACLAFRFFIDAHSLVHKLQSGWFKSRLSDNWCDGPVLCTEFKADNVRAVIEYMYSGLIDLTMENGKDVYEVSDYLGVDELSTLCTDFFVRNVNAVGINEKVGKGALIKT
ncbi:MAG: BTB/POZ domain-containing protein [Sedimenticola sp.]